MGFIGSNFVRHLLSENNEIKITVIDKMGLGSNLTNLEAFAESKHYRFIKGDISNLKVVEGLVKESDAVVNFAAETHVDRSISHPEVFLKNNVLGTFKLLEAVRKHKSNAKYVQVSTDEIYGDILEGSFTEIDRLNPSNPYSATKAAADMLCLAYHRTYGLDIKITRCTNNFGPYQFPEKLIPKTVIRAYKYLPIPVYGTGANIRDWIYVLDHCEAVSKVLSEGNPGEIYNISSDEELPNIKVVKEILKILNRKEGLITFVEDRPGHDIRYSLDSSKIRTELGWKPRQKFASALEETIKWYIKNENWWKPLATKIILNPTPWKIK
jgi:dTDP-glucose 4,6-dehydratase